MNCAWLQHLIEYDCHPCASLHGEPALDVRTPFTWADGEPIGFFVVDQGDTILISDNADTLFHFRGMGMLTGGRRQWQAIRHLAELRGAAMSDQGEIFSVGAKGKAAGLIADFIAGLLAISDYERDNAGALESTTLFADEVEGWLRAWKPQEALTKGVVLRGLSKREHTFDFRLGDRVIAAVQPNPAAIGGLMRKVGDALGGPDADGVELLAVIDDRAAPEKAEEETRIVSSLMKAVPLSKLISAVSRARLH